MFSLNLKRQINGFGGELRQIKGWIVHDFLLQGLRARGSRLLFKHMGGSRNGGTTIAGWFFLGRVPWKWMIPWDTPIYGNLHMIMWSAWFMHSLERWSPWKAGGDVERLGGWEMLSIFGGFEKWGYPNSWTVYKGRSYWNGWFRGTPISGNPRSNTLLLWSLGCLGQRTIWGGHFLPARYNLFDRVKFRWTGSMRDLAMTRLIQPYLGEWFLYD